MAVIKTTLYLREEVYRRLKAVARRQNRPAAEVIREALAEYVARQETKSSRPRSLGAGRSGRGDLSERAEDLLTGLGRE
ncbi:MAG: ribbon-helix-helix protein, CopG family [Planctomycetota bacterium]|jgi:predicted transcriptional regulator